MIDKTLAQTLQKVGFDDKEARVYLALLEIGVGSAARIATLSGLKRPIVYYVLERLIARGYAQELQHGAVKQFSAVDPSRVLSVTQSAVEELRFMLPLMRALQNKGTTKPRIEYHEGVDAIVSTYRSFEKHAGARFITSIHRLGRIAPEMIENWIRSYEHGRTSKRMQCTLLADSPEDRVWGARATQAGQSVRFLPSTAVFEMDFSIVDNIVSITSFDPLFIVVIHSDSIASSAATLFDLAWSVGKSS